MDQKPPMRMESREPKSIRFTPTEWARFTLAARERGVEVTKFVRECSIAGYGYISASEALEAHRRTTA